MLIGMCCILFHFYIKPQHIERKQIVGCCCILFHFYIKPQHSAYPIVDNGGCILFHFYIKPQQMVSNGSYYYVVSYSISTSNHN
mgnify:FL=1